MAKTYWKIPGTDLSEGAATGKIPRKKSLRDLEDESMEKDESGGTSPMKTEEAESERDGFRGWFKRRLENPLVALPTVEPKSSKSAEPSKASSSVAMAAEPESQPEELSSHQESAKVKVAKTKSGEEYPVYRKASDEAKDFSRAFVLARRAGKKKFQWGGRSYTTEMA